MTAARFNLKIKLENRDESSIEVKLKTFRETIVKPVCANHYLIQETIHMPSARKMERIISIHCGVRRR